jgi:hypothetical protein
MDCWRHPTQRRLAGNGGAGKPACYDPFVRLGPVMMVLALLFPAAAPLAARVSDACCASKAGGTCPLKRKASGCAKHATVSCGIQTEPVDAVYPSFREPQPALLLETRTRPVLSTRHAFRVARFDLLSRLPHAPDPPPPKHA